jgi:hypothetical protein
MKRSGRFYTETLFNHGRKNHHKKRALREKPSARFLFESNPADRCRLHDTSSRDTPFSDLDSGRHRIDKRLAQ